LLLTSLLDCNLPHQAIWRVEVDRLVAHLAAMPQPQDVNTELLEAESDRDFWKGRYQDQIILLEGLDPRMDGTEELREHNARLSDFVGEFACPLHQNHLSPFRYWDKCDWEERHELDVGASAACLKARDALVPQTAELRVNQELLRLLRLALPMIGRMHHREHPFPERCQLSSAGKAPACAFRDARAAIQEAEAQR
ncbi:hypothetical protein LCGC14_1167890, partial [marine sediment metagenome]